MEAIQARPLSAKEFFPFTANGPCNADAISQEAQSVASPILTKRALAEMLACSERQIEKLVSAGAIPAPFFIGDSPRWLRDWMNDFFSQLRPGDRLGGKAKRYTISTTIHAAKKAL